MSKLFQHANNTTTTLNGAVAFHSTLNHNLDLFYHAPAMRGKDITELFQKAYKEDSDLAIRILLWLRDVRGGAGVRQLFLDTVTKNIIDEETTIKIINKIPEIGRFKDLLVFVGTPYENTVGSIVERELLAKNGLCAKWMPRQGTAAKFLRKFMKIETPKEWRKLLVSLSDTVEQKICSQDWEGIDFGKLPSYAAKRYQSLFNKKIEDRYTAYKEGLSLGSEKVNASTLYPHDVIKSSINGDAAVSEAQWSALPDYMNGAVGRILPMVDVSPSMSCAAGSGDPYTNTRSGQTSCMDVAISLGLYISERNPGLFHNKFITFHSAPTFVEVSGSLMNRYLTAKRSAWGGSTNIEAAFATLLQTAVRNRLPESEMPEKILILSDMQFDTATRRAETSFETTRRQYEEAGYSLPQVVYWNINSLGGNVPVTTDSPGVALVSGFSPSVLKGVLSGDLDPIKIMLSLVGVDRYKL